MNSRTHHILVYGTLRFRLVRFWVFGSLRGAESGVLEGFRKIGLNIIEDETSLVNGYVLNVSDLELKKIDEYESIGRKYRRFIVCLEDGRDVWVYQRIL